MASRRGPHEIAALKRTSAGQLSMHPRLHSSMLRVSPSESSSLPVAGARTDGDRAAAEAGIVRTWWTCVRCFVPPSEAFAAAGKAAAAHVKANAEKRVAVRFMASSK